MKRLALTCAGVALLTACSSVDTRTRITPPPAPAQGSIAISKDLAPPSSPRDGVALWSRSEAEGNAYVTRLMLTQVTNSPAWTPDTGNPPLAVGQAIAKARDFLERNKLDKSQWFLDGVTLKPQGTQHWFYEVTFRKRGVAVNRMGPAPLKVVVLMTGEVITQKIDAKAP